jgi:hypothetical protein
MIVRRSVTIAAAGHWKRKVDESQRASVRGGELINDREALG